MQSFYEKRNTDGTYYTIFSYIKNLDKLTLAGAELGKHFQPDHAAPFHGYTFKTNDGSDSKEFNTIVFGKIMAESAGTRINARGNHFVPKPVCYVFFFF